MSILQRLKKIEQEKHEILIEEGQKKDTDTRESAEVLEDLSQPTEDEGWFDKTEHSGGEAKLVQFHSVTFKNIPKSNLVWAKLVGFKGGSVMYFARLCPSSEGATLDYIPMPIPADKVLVEFLGLPISFKAMQLVNEEDIAAFNKSPTKSKQTTISSTFKKKQTTEAVQGASSVWDATRCDEVRKRFCQKFGKKRGDQAYEQVLSLAKEYLAFVIENNVDVSDGSRVLERAIPLSPITDAVDMSRFARQGGRASSPLRPGDIIEYEHKIMKGTQTSVITAILRDESPPLRLQNDDIIYLSDLVRKLGKENSSYRLLSEFELEYGNIASESLQAELARHTRDEMEAIARETGYVMTKSSKRQRTETDAQSSPAMTTPVKVFDADCDLSCFSPTAAPSFATPQSSRSKKSPRTPTTATRSAKKKK